MNIWDSEANTENKQVNAGVQNLLQKPKNKKNDFYST